MIIIDRVGNLTGGTEIVVLAIIWGYVPRLTLSYKIELDFGEVL